MSITTAQIRGARGILNWSQQDLAQRTGISATSIGSIENGQTTPRESTIQTIRKTLENAGIEFIGMDGVRVKSANVLILKGIDGFHTFSFDLYETLKTDGREVLQAYVDDTKFANWLGEEAYPHVQRMETLKSKRFKILQKEGDTYFPAKNYADYRWIPAKQFVAVPFIVYGDKLAIVLFEPEPTIIINSFPLVAEAYRSQFDSLWEKAIIPSLDLIEGSTIPSKYLKRDKE
jgi:transcriptional regulator with XRE-family HTH domain